jgi:hypothetical protein
MSLEKIFRFIKKLLSTSTLILIVLVILILTPKYAFFQTQAGYIYHYQNPITGTHVYEEPGTYFRIPYFSIVTRYPKVWAVNFGKTSSYTETPLGEELKPLTLIFADMTTATIPATFMFELDFSNQTEHPLETIHQDFASFDEMIHLLLITTIRNVMENTATPYLGLRFMKAKRCLKQFKADLEHQLKKVVVQKTEPQTVQTETMVANCFDSSTTPTQQIRSLAFYKYGIRVTQITLGSPTPGPLLESKLYDDSKKEAANDEVKTEIAKQMALKEKELAVKQRQDEIAEKEHQLLLNAKKREAQIIEQDQQLEVKRKQQELKITKEQQKLAFERMKNEEKIAKQQHELAMLIKENDIKQTEKQKELVEKTMQVEAQKAEKNNRLAQIEKDKELAEAKADLEIQKAKFEAAQFEAKAIREKGVAEADVLKAKYQALIPEIYLAEIKRDIAQVIYPNLKGIEVSMPRNIVQLGQSGDKLQTNLDVLSSFATIGVMEGLEKKALEADTAAVSSETESQ